MQQPAAAPTSSHGIPRATSFFGCIFLKQVSATPFSVHAPREMLSRERSAGTALHCASPRLQQLLHGVMTGVSHGAKTKTGRYVHLLCTDDVGIAHVRCDP